MNNINKENENFYSISEFSKRICVATSTLRNWDHSNLLKPHHKTSGNHRVYSEKQALDYLAPSKTKVLKIIIEDDSVLNIDNIDMFTEYELKLVCNTINKYITK